MGGDQGGGRVGGKEHRYSQAIMYFCLGIFEHVGTVSGRCM